MYKFSKAKIYLILFVCFLGVFYSVPNFVKDKSALPDWWQPVNLGLDLQGGSHLLLEVETDVVLKERMLSNADSVRQALREKRIRYLSLKANAENVTFKVPNIADESKAISVIKKIDRDLVVEKVDDKIELTYSEEAFKQLILKTVDQSIEIVRRRIDELGTKEPTIQRQGKNRILVQLPGVENPEAVKTLLGKTAKLSFHLVDDRSSVSDARRGRISASSKLMPGSAGSYQSQYLIERRIVVGGEHLTDSQPSFQEGNPVVSFKFDTLGGKKFGEATRKNVGRSLAIILDGEVISAPNIQGAIMGGSGVITGSFSVSEAQELALLLRSGALPAPLNVLEERTVGPGLGADSIKAGGYACFIGLAGVIVFMLLAYGLFGTFTTIALCVNMFLLLGALSFLQATLTLPGIAGIVLTMGMAVDANVLIFERMREEVKYGRNLNVSIDAGFKNAFSTIIDANLTTMAAAFVLFYFGTGPVRGFAVTLAIGILTSLFSAIMVTRLIVATWVNKSKPKSLPIL